MTLFTIHCLSCRSRLKVLEAVAIGKIVACPKCGSMVPVQPPAGWQPPVDRVPVAAAPSQNPPSEIRRVPAEDGSSGAHLLRGDKPRGSGAEVAASPPQPADASPAVPPPRGASAMRPLWWASGAAGVGLVSLLLWWGLRSTAATVDVSVASPVPAEPPTPAPVAEIALLDSSADTIELLMEDRSDPESPESEMDAVEDAALQEADDGEEAELPAEEADSRPPAADSDDDEAEAAGEPESDAASEPPTGAVPAVLGFSYRPIDVQARLADPIGRFRCARLPLHKFTALVAQVSTLSITLDVDSLADAGAAFDAPISVDQADGTVADVLTAALAPHGLAYEVAGDQLVIGDGRPDRLTPRTERHDLRTLVQPGCTAADVARLVQTFVLPGGWGIDEEFGKIDIDGDAILVTHLPAAQRRTAEFLNRLRLARAAGGRGGSREADSRLATRAALIQSRLAGPFLSTFHRPTKLSRIVRHLETRSGATILVDWRSLRSAGIPHSAETTLSVDNRPLSEALDALLKPLGLGYRALGNDHLQIFSLADLRSRPDVEWYPVADLTENDAAGADLVGRLRTDLSLSPRQPTAAGAIYFDQPSRTLIVRQPFPVQVRLEASLAQRRGEQAPTQDR